MIGAYSREKAIPSIGLFIDSTCNRQNKYFRTEPFGGDLHFVYLNRSLEYLHQYTAGTYPFSDPSLEDQAPHVPWQVRFLQDVHLNMRVHPEPRVRTKFLTCWDFHMRRYPTMIQALVQGGFALDALTGRPAWSAEAAAMLVDIQYFKQM